LVINALVIGIGVIVSAGAGKAPSQTRPADPYLKSLGFKSGNDSYIPPILKDLKFIDSSGTPTGEWQRYRSGDLSRAVMAQAIRSAYPDLFVTYPDAHRKDTEALRNYFSTHSAKSVTTLALMVRTFKVLCEFADFDSAPLPGLPSSGHPQQIPITPASGSPAHLPHHSSAGMTVNINVQLQLQATDDASIYDKFFAAMKKHLFTTE